MWRGPARLLTGKMLLSVPRRRVLAVNAALMYAFPKSSGPTYLTVQKRLSRSRSRADELPAVFFLCGVRGLVENTESLRIVTQQADLFLAAFSAFGYRDAELRQRKQ